VFHIKLLDEPNSMYAGFAVKVIVGTMLTVAVCDTVPPGPVAVIVYIVLVDGVTTIEPFRAVPPIP
jgi:hypothetical protein